MTIGGEMPEDRMPVLGLSVLTSSVDISQVITNPLDLYRTHLATILAGITDCGEEEAYKSIQWPNNIFNGDLAVVLPKLRPGAKADKLAVELMEKFPKDHPLLPLPVLDGVHLRVFVSATALAHILLPNILDETRTYGSNLARPILQTIERQRLVIEFSSPNIASEFQGKHLRSTIIGAFISRLYGTMGWDVTRLNYLGDWGKPIALLYVGWMKFGSQEAYDSDPAGHLLEVYHKIEDLFQPEQQASRHARDEAAKEGKDDGEVQAELESKGIFAERNEAFKKLEDGDEELVTFWKKTRGAIIEDYQTFYERLDIQFDDYSGESEVRVETMVEVEQMLKDKNISEESAGAWMVDMKKLGAKAGHVFVRDRSGSSTYLLRDLAAVLERSRKYSFDKMIYVVASDNSVHFSQMFKVLEALDKELASKVHHVKFSEVSKMATTLGKGYKPQTILDKCEEAIATLPEIEAERTAMISKSEQDSQALATSALLIQELSTRSATVHAFDTTTLPSFKFGSGPDLQYWYVKVTSLLSGHSATARLSDEDFEALAEEDKANLLRILAQYPEVINVTYKSLSPEPSSIVTYLASVTEQLSDCFDEDEGELDMTPGLAALLEATRIVLGNGMKLLGLTPISKIPQERADTPIAG